ncbi:MAG: EscS/YscS/HrcS family type III secretion system export apparatus protein [Proteobacteria bacterium SG_bin7]|nr:MAG: EscS/YscS/HrcS family type III secretion system export apparatus protein [Proteobacteria bacterium SG_bin7]
MGEDLIIKLGHDALKTSAMIAAPLLLGALVTGVIISIFQAVTQINEATLTFVPKLLIIAIILILAGPWMLDHMRTYTVNLIENITMYVRK